MIRRRDQSYRRCEFMLSDTWLRQDMMDLILRNARFDKFNLMNCVLIRFPISSKEDRRTHPLQTADNDFKFNQHGLSRRRIDRLIHQSLRLPIQSRVYMRCERARMSAASHPFLIFGILVSSASVRAAACHVNTCWRTLGACAWCWWCWTHSPA